MQTINLSQAFAQFSETWHPRIVGAVNDSHVKIVKLHGEFVWHRHEVEDELFLVIQGTLIIKTHEGDLVIHAGEFAIIPRGVEHCPVAEQEVQVLLLEPKTTQNTGSSAVSERTVLAEWLPGLEPDANA